MDDLPGNMKLPSFGECLLIGSLLGLCQGLQIKETFRFWDVPLFEADGGGGLPFDLGHLLAPTNVATRKYQIWFSIFPGGIFLSKFSYKF